MDAPPSPNHVFNFPEAEFEEDPKEEPEEEVKEDPEEDPEEDTEDDSPVIENEALEMPPVERCEKKRKVDMETCSSEIREGKKRMDKMEQGLGDEMQFSSKVEHRVTDVENKEQERDEEMVKVKKRLGTLEANYSLVLSDRDEWRRAFFNLQALVFERLGWGAWDARPGVGNDGP
nr:hypothetical protein [Tanacetum cinerariifolium]